MYKKILSFILILTLCMGTMANTSVYAKESNENDEETFLTIDNNGMDEAPISGTNEIAIPQNGSEVHMENVETQASMFSLRPTNEVVDERYTVLVLDTSAATNFSDDESIFYIADTALPQVKKASKKFIKDISSSSGNNYIGIVSYGNNTSQIVHPFSNDMNTLLNAIDSLSASGSRSVYNGLTAAEQLIDSVTNENAIKNIILFTTGMTTEGVYNYTGHYNKSTVGSNWFNAKTGVRLYAYANSAYTVAERLKQKCSIYSIGLFNVMEDMPKQGHDIVHFFKLCACDWASSQDYFYDVKNPDDLEFVFGQVAKSMIKCTGTFAYPGKDSDYTSTYYYDDNYFKGTSYVYYPQLATMSLCLELSSWGSKEESDYTKKMKNAEALLYELGFVGFDHNYTDFAEEGIDGKPTKDSVGVVAANKQLSFDGKKYTLIAVAIRGGEYEREWASNFKIGEEGNHEGFSEARDIVIAFLEEYIKEQGINGDIKLWITGYSRAAATANMVAGAIDNGDIDLGSCNLALTDLFAYTFETPAGVIKSETKDAKYNNIFNTINKNDLVPMVAPKDWEFGRYGIDKFLSTAEADGLDAYEENLSAMLKRYQEMDGYEDYLIDDFTMKKVKIGGWTILPDKFINIVEDTNDKTSMNYFLDYYITILAKNHIKNRTNYVDNYQDGIRDACGIFFGTDPEKKDKLLEAVSNKLSENWIWILSEYLKPIDGESAAYIKIAEYLKDCLDEVGITNYSQDEFDNSVKMIFKLLVRVVASHPNLATTLVMNRENIMQAHFPEVCLAWMQSMDTNYTTDAKLNFSTGKYRIIRINCPIDVTVYDPEGNTLASIVNDTPQPDGKVLTVFNDNDEKLVFLPVHHDYVLRLTATDDGVMNYAVQEYDPYAGETNHAIFFNDITITKGQEYTAYLPSYSKEDTENCTGIVANTNYTLYLNETQILPNEELIGEEVFNAYYNINATAEDTSMGIVFGAGICQYGTFTKIIAEAYDGFEFIGWYEGEDLVSTESEYKFRVSKDVDLVAVFKKSSQEDTSEENKDENTENDQQTVIEGKFRVTSNWNTGFSGEVTLTNTTNSMIHNWIVAFDLPYEIINIWNGTITSYEDGIYTVQNAGYNGDINPGESVTFGFIAKLDTDIVTEPDNYTLISKPVIDATQNCEITYKVNGDWETAFTGQIEINNISSKEIYDWTLEFDSSHDFDQFWDAEIISHEGNHYIIKNKGYNATIGAGQQLVLGFEAKCIDANSSDEPVNYHLTMIHMN